MASELFWRRLNHFTEQERSKGSARKLLDSIKENEYINKPVHLSEVRSREEVIQLIEDYVLQFLAFLRDEKLPKFVLNKRGGVSNTVFSMNRGMEMLNDVTMHEISLSNELSRKKYSVMVACLSVIYKLLQSNKHSTKRDLFYSDVNLFQHQRVVDEAISDLSCMLGVPRYCLNVISSSKGFIYGDLSFVDVDGNLLTCNQNGLQVPNHVEALTSLKSDARYILVVEKEATYQRLVEHKLNDRLGPCAVLTGKGFPDINTRMLLHKMWKTFEVPVFALVDADPHGIEILCTYKFGSKALSCEAAHLTCPSMKWLGIQPKDISFMDIPRDVLIPFSNADKKKALDLLKRPYISQNADYRQQVEILINSKMKAEIECLDSISHSFMTDIYLPQKIRNCDWL